MARNLDEFQTSTEHTSADHVGIPGVTSSFGGDGADGFDVVEKVSAA
jgi:hypothetical protein